jgi:hypothetical protein
MKLLLTLLFIGVLDNCFSQEIVNVVMVDKNGITENAKDADAFIIVKKFDNHFQRLDYKMHAPLVKERNYTDSTLTILQGKYYEYDANGILSLIGEYENNLKENTWNIYNDTGKVILQEKYKNGLLIETIDPDTVKKVEPNKDSLDKDEKEASFGKGKKDWMKYLVKNLKPDVSLNSVNGGQVRVMYIVDTLGRCTDITLRKSVEFVLDEEAKRIIYNSPLWNSAYQKGKKVKAYRIQPITFVKQ